MRAARSTSADGAGPGDEPSGPSGPGTVPSPSTPNAMFAARVSENRNESWGTTPILLRRTRGSILRMGSPSNRISPSVGSWIRGIRFTRVLLPDPVAPTTATVRPASAMNETSFSTMRSVPG